MVLVVVARPGTSPTEEDVIAWCRDRLSPFKVPSAVEFAASLPRTSVGKLRKAELRSQLTRQDLPRLTNFRRTE
ncbi:MAG: AMP-binding enzyme [Trebonia sp.]